MKSLLGAPVLAVWLTAAAAYAAPEEFAYCTVCHGAEGNGNVAIRAPKIAGLDAAYLTRQLEAFRVGWRGMHADDRQGREMSFVALTLADDSTLARAVAFVGTLEPKTPARSVDGNARRGAKHYEPCAACHGERAQGNAELQAPALAGQSDWYLVAQLEGYRAGWRGIDPADTAGTQMRAMAAALPNKKSIADVVAYIVSLH
jgi:cytochrome c oxidase subunit II